jgi:hypothetical protein
MTPVSGGEIKGDVTLPKERSPSFYGKLGFDKQTSENLRIRLTGSFYATSSSVSNTFYGGDQTGSLYYAVMDNTLSAGFTSGRLNPCLRDKIIAVILNTFITWKDLDFFANSEQEKDR